MIVVEAMAFRPTENLDADHWPMVNEEGYCMAYQERGRWVNWWSKRLSFFEVFWGFWSNKDVSNIPSQEELDKVRLNYITLPVRQSLSSQALISDTACQKALLVGQK